MSIAPMTIVITKLIVTGSMTVLLQWVDRTVRENSCRPEPLLDNPEAIDRREGIINND